MHCRWCRPQRQLRPGRATLCTEPGVRLLLPASRQRPAVSEHRYAGAAAGPVHGACRRAEAGMSIGSASVADDGLLSSLRYLFADFLGEDDDSTPFLPDGLPENVAPVVSDAIHLLTDYQSAGYARLYVDRVR